MQTIRAWNDSLWSSFEESITPLPAGSTDSKIAHTLPASALLPALGTGCLVAAANLTSHAASFFSEEEDPQKDFSAVCRDSRLWSKLGDLQAKVRLGQDNPNFLFGVATSTFQDSGAIHCPQSQWETWEKKYLPAENCSQDSANLFVLYQTPAGRKEITDRLHKLGVTSYRFSVEWSQIQPERDIFEDSVLTIYVDLCKHLRDQGIQPMVTLHHFSEPKWFHEAGSFEKEENIAPFVEFSKRTFTALTRAYYGKPLVEFFCTINEPAVEAIMRYVKGDFSPGTLLRYDRAGMFLKTVLKAHIKAYTVLKEIAPLVQIGIVHQAFNCVPKNPLLFPATRYINRLMNEAPLRFFKEGKFELKIPLLCNIVEEGLQPKTDFVGLQYYSRPLIGLLGSTSRHEPMTTMPWREDPEGLYEAILESHAAFKAPVIITENGISTTNDEQRSRYMLRALYATQKAQEVIGKANLKGYYVWSFCDNSEWIFGLDPQKFGVYAVEKVNGKRVLATEPKLGMESFIKVAKACKATVHPAKV